MIVTTGNLFFFKISATVQDKENYRIDPRRAMVKPKNIQAFSPKKTLLVLKSVDDQHLKEFCAKICSFKSPDSYKGKGILYKNQIITLKEGKKK